MGESLGGITVLECSTSQIKPDERPEKWEAATGRRVKVVPAPNAGRDLSAYTRGFYSDSGIGFFDYTCNALWMSRSKEKCSSDGCRDMCIELVLSKQGGVVQNDSEYVYGRGEMYVADLAQPLRNVTANYRAMGVILPHHKVIEALGERPTNLAGRGVRASGARSLLSAHMQTIAGDWASFSMENRALALRTVAELAMAALQETVHQPMNPELVATGLYGYLLSLIDRHYRQYDFTPARLAKLAGISESKLYRVFAQHGRRVADTIWQTRLKRAYDLLISPGQHNRTLSDIAAICGFLDQSTFNRMFKRKYGATPGDLRAGARKNAREE